MFVPPRLGSVTSKRRGHNVSLKPVLALAIIGMASLAAALVLAITGLGRTTPATISREWIALLLVWWLVFVGWGLLYSLLCRRLAGLSVAHSVGLGALSHAPLLLCLVLVYALYGNEDFYHTYLRTTEGEQVLRPIVGYYLLFPLMPQLLALATVRRDSIARGVARHARRLREMGWAYLIPLALVNSVLWPFWSGFSEGGDPLLDPRGVLPHVIVGAINAAFLAFLPVESGKRPKSVHGVMVLAALTRLAYMAVRASHGAVFDEETALYFKYGREFGLGQYPEMEYPQGALLLFTAGFFLSRDRIGSFVYIFPLVNLAADLLTILCFLRLGRRWQNEERAWLLAVFYALSPFTLVFWFGKYDAIPAALFALGLWLFVNGRLGSSALALASGFLVKWLPAIAAPFLVVRLLQQRTPKAATRYVLTVGLAIAVVIVPFWLISPEKVLLPYQFQGTRLIIGESLPYLAAQLVAPEIRIPAHSFPWYDIEGSVHFAQLAVAVQMVAVVGAFLMACFVRGGLRTTVSLTSGGLALFVVLNRVFSPQYTVLLLAAYSLALLSLAPSRTIDRISVLLFVSITCLNYLVWPVWVPFWLQANALFFALNLGIIFYIMLSAIRERSGGRP